MNEELLKQLYTKFNLASKGDLNTFIKDMQNEEVAKGFHAKYLSTKGDFNKFKSDLYTSPTNIPQNSTSSSGTGKLDHSFVKNYIGTLESDNKYNVLNKAGTSATGKYQHIWGGKEGHGPSITRITGVKTQEEYLNNPEAQEKYQDYLLPMYEKKLPELRKLATQLGKDYTDEELMYIQHHSWAKADNYIRGEDVADKKGLDAAIAKGRAAGLVTPRKITNNVINQSTDFITITNDVLPTRGGAAFKSPVDKRMVDKLSGFMQEHNLVVTDTNDTKIHKSSAQKSGKSLDVNFTDKTIIPEKIKTAVLDAQRRGLKFVYEIKDKRVYDAFMKTRPDLKEHIMHNPDATGNHFSVYHADNYTPDNTLLPSSKNIPEDKLNYVKNLKAKVYQESYKENEKISGARTASGALNAASKLITEGVIGATASTVSRIFSPNNSYQRALHRLVATGQIDISGLDNAQLVELANSAEAVADLKKQADVAKKDYKNQLEDKGFFEGLGDMVAGSWVDKIAGINSDTRLDTDNGKININTSLRGSITGRQEYMGAANYRTPEEILNLTSHPLAKNPKDPNDKHNKELRRIQDVILRGDQKLYDHETSGHILRSSLAQGRLQELEKELKKLGGEDVFKTLESFNKKYQDKTITEEEQQQYEFFVNKLNSTGGALEQYDVAAKQYNYASDNIKAIEGKYGILTKIKKLRKEDQASVDAVDRETVWWRKRGHEVMDFVNDFSEAMVEMPKSIALAAGVLGEAVTGVDIGATNSAKAQADINTKRIKSTRDQREFMGDSMFIDDKQVVFKNNKAIAIYDKDGYEIQDEALLKTANEKLEKEHGGKQGDLDNFYNYGALWEGFKDNAPMLASMYFTGGMSRGIAAGATAKALQGGAAGSRVSRVLAKPFMSARGIESMSMMPVYLKDTMEQAINDGAITPGQIISTTMVKLGVEAVAESLSIGGLGKMLAGKGITSKIIKDSLDKKLVDVVKHYSTGKITGADFTKHMGRAALETIKELGGEGFEEAIVAATEGSVNQMLNSVLDTNYNEEQSSWHEIASAGAVGMAAAISMSGPKLIAETIGYKEGIRENYKSLAASVIGGYPIADVKGNTVANPDTFKQYLNAAVEAGKIDKKDADKYSSAIQAAAERTKFTKDIDTEQGFIDRVLSRDKGLEVKDKFINYARNLAFNQALTGVKEANNNFEEAVKSAKVGSYEKIISELEMNAYKNVFSIATPTMIGIDKKLDKAEVTQLSSKQESILDAINSSSYNSENKALAFELRMKQAANDIIKSRTNVSTKTAEELAKEEEALKKTEEALKLKNQQQKDDADVLANRGTPKQIQAVLTRTKAKIDELFDNHRKLSGDEMPDFSIDLITDILDSSPEILKGELADYADKKLKVINAKAYSKQIQKIKQQQKKFKPTNSSKTPPEEAFNAAYKDKPDLEKKDGDRLIPIFKADLDEAINIATKNGDQQGVNIWKTIKQDLESGKSYRDLYITNPEFRNFVDAQLQKEASQPKTETDVTFRSTKVVDLKSGDKFEKNKKIYTVKNVSVTAAEKGSIIIIETEEGVSFKSLYKNPANFKVNKVISEEIPTSKKPTRTKEQKKVIAKINKLIEDGKKATLVSETEEKESHYSLLGKLYRRVSTYVHGLTKFGGQDSVTNLKNSLPVGNFFDTFARLYYNNPDLTVEEFKAALEERPDKDEFRNMSPEAVFADSLKKFNDIQEQIKKDLGGDENLVFITDNIFVHADIKNDEFDGVAGTLDMVVVDSKGEVHIYDFKTKSQKDARYPITTKSLETPFDSNSISDQVKWTKQQTAYSKLLLDTFGYKPNINIIVLPVTYTRENFKGDFNNKAEVDAFKPAPSNVGLAAPGFIYKLKYDENNKLVVDLDAYRKANKGNQGGQQGGQGGQGGNPPQPKSTVNKVLLDGYKASLADELLIQEYFKADSPLYIERIVKKDANNVEKESVRIVGYFQPNKKGGEFGTYGKNKQAVVFQEGVGNNTDLLARLLERIKENGGERVETRLEKKPYWRRRTFTPITIGKIKNTTYEISRKSNNKQDYFVITGLTTNKTLPYEQYSQVKQVILDDLATKLADKKIKQDEYDKAVKDVEYHFSTQNKPQIKDDALDKMAPHLYVIGQSWQDNTPIVLLNKETDGNDAVTINKFIRDYKLKYPNVSDEDLQAIKDILNTPNNNGKVVYIEGNIVVPFDTLKVAEDPTTLASITRKLTALSQAEAGKASWRTDNEESLADDVRKRIREAKDYTSDPSKANVHGRILEFFSAGPENRNAQIEKGVKEDELQSLYYIIRTPSEENPQEDETKRIYVTLKQAIDIVSEIRVHVGHDVIRNATDPDVKDTVKRVLRVPNMVSNEKNIVYNFAHFLEPQSGEVQTPPQTPSQEPVEATIEESIPVDKNEIPVDKEFTEKPSSSTTDIKGGDNNLDEIFKISDKDYSGKVDEAVTYLKTRFEEIGVEVNDDVLRNLVKGTTEEGSRVWGAFHNAMVTLSALSGEKIGKHEAMHAAEVMFHTPEQLKFLRQEMLSRYGKELGITKTKVDDLTTDELKSIREVLATEFEDYKNSLLLPEGFSKKYPTISKFIEKLFNFIKKNYLIGRSYITNKKSIDQLFYEVENNILGRDFIGRRKKSTGDTFKKALDTLNEPDFKISNWENLAAKEFADFIAKDMFSDFLSSAYGKNNVNEVLAERKDLTISSITQKFQKKLKTHLDKYKSKIVEANGLDVNSDKYKAFSALLDDIHKQYIGKDSNQAFKLIVNKGLGNRYAGVVDYDDMDADATTVNDETIKEMDEEAISGNLEAWQTKQGKVDAKTKSSSRLREFFSGIPKIVRRVANGKSSRLAVKHPLLYNTRFYSGEYIHNKLLNELSDHSNYDDFINKINSLVSKYHFMADILASVMGLDEQQILEAYDNGSLKLPPDLLVRQDYYTEQGYKLWIIKDIYYAIGDQNNQDPVKVLTKSTNGKVSEVQIARSVQNTDYDNAITTIKQTIETKLEDETSKKELVDSLQAVITGIEKGTPVGNAISKAFTELGYEASTDLLIHLMPTVTTKEGSDNLKQIKSIFHDILDGINAQKSTIDPSLYGINSLAELISTYSIISSGLSYQNVEGENEFAHKNSNFLSRTQALWSKGKERIKEWANKMRYVNGNPDMPIVMHAYMDIYDDILDKNNDFKILDDGFTQVLRQQNSGKAYADMTEDEIAAASINLFLTRFNSKNAKNTIKPNHGLFHFLVFSDSPARKILHAPVLNIDAITSKLSKIIYGELDRIDIVNRVKEVDIFEKLSKAGKIIQTIPELNTVELIDDQGRTISFLDAFNKGDNWTNFNDSSPANISYFRFVDKQGKKTDAVRVETSKSHKDVLDMILRNILLDNLDNYVKTIYNDNVKNLTADISDAELEKFYLNSFYYNIATKIMFSGDPAHYKPDADGNTNTDGVKRDKQQIAPNIGLIFEKPTFNIAILSDIYKVTSNVNNTETRANLTDAQSFHTLARRIEIMKAMPNWELHEKEIMEIVNRINDNSYTNEDDYKRDLGSVHFQILKPFLYTQVDRSIKTGETTSANFKVPLQLKDSEAVLLPTEAYRVYGQFNYVRPTSISDITPDKYVNPELARTLFMMEKGNIDTVIFESGSKAEVFGNINIETLTDDEVNTLANPDPNNIREHRVVTLNNSDYGIQMDVPRKDMEEKVGQGSQEHKIMSANVDENWTYTTKDGTVYKGQEGLNDILQQIQTLNAEENFKKVVNKLVKENGEIDVNKVLDIVSDGLIDKTVNIDTIEGLELVKEDGKTLIPLELFGKQAEKVLVSLFKAVSKIKGKGAALVNKSAFGYIRDNASVSFENEKGGKKEIDYTNDLSLIKDLKGNIKYYEAIVPVYDPIIYEFIDANGELLLDEDGNPRIPEKLLYAFFYRIPTEDKYSMFPIKIKKFSMPVEGGGIMLPREATETSGLDFDVDKLYGYYYNFKIHYPAEFRTYTINKLSKYLLNPSGEKSDEEPTKEEKAKAKENATRYFDALEDATLIEDFNEDDLANFQVLKEGLQSVEESHKYLGDKFSTNPENFIEIVEPSVKNSKSAHNLKLDIYFSLVNTAAYTRDALTGGSKERLKKLKNDLFGNQKKIPYSFADPSYIVKTANKNITGKRLIGIFANANAFYNLIQGVAKVDLVVPFGITINGTPYDMTSIGGVNSQISKNIAELLFASTEDVKDPVLELLGINTQTAGLLITLLTMTTEKNEIIKFEDAISILQDPEIQAAAKEADRTGKRFSQIYKGNTYKTLVDISDAYNNIVSAAKIDQAIGPDFFTVENKITAIDDILQTKDESYPFHFESVRDILPSITGSSKIKQLNVYRRALEKEIEIFEKVFSFLKTEIRGYLDQIKSISKNGRLSADQKDKLAYKMYDAAIQAYLQEKGELDDLMDNFPQEFLNYDFPPNSNILRQAIEKTDEDILNMRWVNINAGNALELYKEAFSRLFESDPKMAGKLAKYAFLTGTKFKMDSIVKIVPNEFFKTTDGQAIRNIINGNTLNNYLLGINVRESMMINNYQMILPKEELVAGDGGTFVLASEVFTPKEYIWNTDDKGNDIIWQNIKNTSEYIKYHVVEKTKFPNYLLKPKTSSTFVKNNKVSNKGATSTTIAAEIYSKLGTRTKYKNVIFEEWGKLKDYKEAISPISVVSTRIQGTNEHFGNPFSSDENVLSQNPSLIRTKSTKESVEKYIDWVINSKDERAKWIREQLKSGKLKGKAILYYKELKEPSHATALDYLINEYDWNSVETSATPVFDTLPRKSSTPTMTYAGIGSRETPPEILEQMTKAAKYLEDQGYTLRSGAAEGADTAFEKGVTGKKQIFKGFDKTGEKEIKIAHEIHPNLKGAMESSKKKAIAAGKDGEKSAWAVQNLMARNTNQIFGAKLDTPVDFVLFYAKESKNPLRPEGGTGQAVEMARRKGIPTINMADQNWRQQLSDILKNNEPPIDNNETTEC